MQTHDTEDKKGNDDDQECSNTVKITKRSSTVPCGRSGPSSAFPAHEDVDVLKRPRSHPSTGVPEGLGKAAGRCGVGWQGGTGAHGG